MHSSVRVPITRLGAMSSVAGSFDVRRKSVSADVRTPGAITPPRKTPSAVMQSKVVAVPRSTTIASRSIDAARRQRVDDAVGADGERLVDVERDRQRRRASTIERRSDREVAHGTPRERRRHARHDRPDRHAPHDVRRESAGREQRLQAAPRIRRACARRRS